jgi:hypothetical protein
MIPQHLLDDYCLARRMNDKKAQLEVADQIVDELVPYLMDRLAQLMMERVHPNV